MLRAQMYSLKMVPMIDLSGLILSVENRPAFIQKFTVIIPLKYYTHIIRGILHRGSGLDVRWLDFVLASLRFRKSLD